MALYHKATITPSKAEMVEQLLRKPEWDCPVEGEPLEVIGAFRFDDPAGRVGMETHLVRSGGEVLQVPLTYRDEPNEDAKDSLVGEMEHSALGRRWVYDGLGDPQFLVMLAAVSLTGQGEALGMVVYDGDWFIAPSHVRITGGGWTQERVSVDNFAPTGSDSNTATFANDGFSLTFHRRITPGPQPTIGLRATWPGLAEPVVLTEVTPA